MKALLLTLSMLFLATSVRAGDFIWGPGGYVAHLEQIVGHAGRGATPEEVQNASRELRWINQNEAHLRRLMQFVSEQQAVM